MTELPKIRRLPVLQPLGPRDVEVPIALASEPYMPADAPVFSNPPLKNSDRPFRTSSYMIWAELPDTPHELLLVHSYTGAYDKVSRRVVDYLRALEGKHPKPLYGNWTSDSQTPAANQSLSDETMEKLRKRGYLTQMTEEEEEGLFIKSAAHRHHIATHRSPGYILMPTYECNLRCPYCFQDHMRTDPTYKHLLRCMSPEMVERILKGMLDIERAHGTSADTVRNVTLFGGEPLLLESKPIIEQIVNGLLAMGNASISAITNATELEHYADLLGPQKIRFLQVTIDGPPAIHDQRRIYADGSGSFEKIARNVDLALSLGVRISARMNIDRTNIHLLPAIADEFQSRGWTAHKGFSSYVAPVHGEGKDGVKTTFNSWQLNQALADLQRDHPTVRKIGHGDDSLVQRVRSIYGTRANPMSGFKADFCGAHTTMYIFDAFGDIYACWERTGDPSVRVGRVEEDGQVFMNAALMEKWRSRSVVSNPVCRKCRYASYCGGGCAVLAEEKQGDIHANYCDGFAKRFRHSAVAAYLEHMAGDAPERDAERVCDL
jgi:uncharacterized protein